MAQTGAFRYTTVQAHEFLSQISSVEPAFALFDYLPRVYLFVKDHHHRFVKVNRGWLLMHGLNSEPEALGLSDHDFHPPVLAAQYVEEDRRVMASRRALPDQNWLVRGADGMPRWYWSTKIPLLDRRGRVFGIAGVMRPSEGTGDAPAGYARLTPALDFVLARYDQRITVASMAAQAHLSVSQLQREFQNLYGMTPSDYILRVRLLMARQKLEQTKDAAGRIALECGFYDQSHFNRAFLAATGLRPLEYRRRFAPKGSRLVKAGVRRS